VFCESVAELCDSPAAGAEVCESAVAVAPWSLEFEAPAASALPEPLVELPAAGSPLVLLPWSEAVLPPWSVAAVLPWSEAVLPPWSDAPAVPEAAVALSLEGFAVAESAVPEF